MGPEDEHAPPVQNAEFRFYRELNDFLPTERRQKTFRVDFSGTPAVRDTIQAIGVPHSAIDLILVDGESVDFSHRLAGGERISVYPEFEKLDISPLQRLRPRPLRRSCFAVDVHLGRLARYLRMLGFDTAWDRASDDAQIIDRSLSEKRIILTRDRGILKQKRVTRAYWLRSDRPDRQIREVVRALDLRAQIRPFTRCMDCNGQLETVAKTDIRGRIDENIRRRFEEFAQCRECRKIYWKGSHYDRMLELTRRLESAPCAE